MIKRLAVSLALTVASAAAMFGFWHLLDWLYSIGGPNLVRSIVSGLAFATVWILIYQGIKHAR